VAELTVLPTATVITTLPDETSIGALVRSGCLIRVGCKRGGCESFSATGSALMSPLLWKFARRTPRA
jgi:hypothetical protein